MARKILSALIIIAAGLCVAACSEESKEQHQPVSDMTFMISLQSPVEGAAGDPVTFKFYSGKGPLQTDKVLLKPASGEDVVCDIIAVSSDSFTFQLAADMPVGEYKCGFYIKRGEQTKKVGEVDFIIVRRIEVEEKEGYNIYGMITCGDEGVAGVVVSDGVECTQTDADGVYYLKSQEENRVVFMSIPSGYEAISDVVLPKFHKYIDGNPTTVERVDWQLVKVDNDDHIMYVLGDLHLANRTNDIAQFGLFTADLEKEVEANKAKRQYVLTLGDMTWDQYWIPNAFDLYTYVETAKKEFSGVQIFNTIGNHDHDANAVGDFNTVSIFKQAVAPTYYSFNIGGIHYVVLDDILCTNNGTGSRTYDSTLTSAQLEWLKKDLSYVDKSTPLVLTMHAHIYNEVGNANVSNVEELETICSGYTTHVMTAHTHVVWNNDKLFSKKLYHHNSGAVCGTWWWTGYYTPRLGLCKDGAPSGYYKYEMKGTDIKWRMKPTGRDYSHMFRSYDRNETVITAAKFAPAADATLATAFEKSAASWTAESSDNYIYINVFDYDPSWKIEVTENGNQLTPQLVKIKDPLHLISYEAKRYNAGKTPTSSFLSYTVNSHIFRVKASSATSTVEIKVTDRFGNTSTESMKRPKEFSIVAYNK